MTGLQVQEKRAFADCANALFSWICRRCFSIPYSLFPNPYSLFLEVQVQRHLDLAGGADGMGDNAQARRG